MDSASPLRFVRNDNDKKGTNILFLFQIGQFKLFKRVSSKNAGSFLLHNLQNRSIILNNIYSGEG